MSLDLTMTINTCEKCGRWDTIYQGNYTYNVSRMWYAIYPEHEYMIPIDGMTGAEALSILQYAIDQMNANPQLFETLNPINGWGEFVSFKLWIRLLIEHCIDYPDGIWSADR